MTRITCQNKNCEFYNFGDCEAYEITICCDETRDTIYEMWCNEGRD